ncbi:MAG: ester cyclase [Deltaproteobacteria bacterium]|jgi:steroid delta-isomerase-like uncharacterized protein|nr:ester cyclase [Deltaproteobacteria bacterium]
MSSSEMNREVVREYVEAFNCLDIEALRALFTPDAIVHGVLGSGDLDKVIPIWRRLHEGIAIHLTVDEIVAEGDQVAVRYTERGKSVGEFLGNPPTGKTYEVVAMEWFVMKDGKIAKRWGARDSAAMARQMGLSIP